MSPKNPVTPTGIEPGTVRLVAQCLNHYAAPGPLASIIRIKIAITSVLKRLRSRSYNLHGMLLVIQLQLTEAFNKM